jgi:hypothetical protein
MSEGNGLDLCGEDLVALEELITEVVGSLECFSAMPARNLKFR